MLRDKTSKREGFSFAELVVVMLVMVIVIGFLIICIQKLRFNDHIPGEVNARTITVMNLTQITLACHSFNDVHKRLPPAFGKFGEMKFPASVAVHLAPFVELDDFYKAYLMGEGKGYEITKAIIPQFLSPQDRTMVNNGAGAQSFAANLRVFSDNGYNTPFDLDMRPMAAVEPGSASIPGSFPDGTSNTMAFVTKFAECGDGGSRYAAAPNSKFAAFFGQNATQVPADPSDVTATFQLAPDKDQCRPTPLMAQSFHKTGIFVTFFDGSLRFVKPTISARTWNLLVQPNDNMPLGDDWND